MTDVNWRVPRAWPGERVFVVGGGPSVNPAVFPALKEQGRVIAVNSSFRELPDADLVCWADDRWVRANQEALGDFKGLRVARKSPPIELGYDVKLVHRTQPIGDIRPLSDDPGKVGGYCSGAMGLNLAYLFGAAEIVLLGFDMSFAEGVSHWHVYNTVASTESHYTDYFLNHFNAFAPVLKQAGIRVYDCALNGRLACFEKRAIEEFLPNVQRRIVSGVRR